MAYFPTGDPPYWPLPYWSIYPIPPYYNPATTAPFIQTWPKFVDPPDIEAIFKNSKKLWGSFERIYPNNEYFN